MTFTLKKLKDCGVNDIQCVFDWIKGFEKELREKQIGGKHPDYYKLLREILGE